jgi:HYR domain
MARTYLISAAIILVLVFGIFFNSNTITTTTTTAIAQQQQTGRINGMGASEIPLRVCDTSSTKDFLTVKFDAFFLLSPDGKTGTVTSGKGILKTTDSEAFAYLLITGGKINLDSKLYTLKGSAAFQSPSYCNPPSTVEFSIAKPDGSQLKCGNSDLITFNSISLTGSVSGNVSCTTIPITNNTTNNTIIDTTPPTVTATLTPKAPEGQNGFYVQPVTVTWSGDDGPSGSGISSCDSPTSYSGPDGASIVLEGHCTDKAGNVGKGSVTIAYDANPPTINIPRSIIKEATSPQGSPFTYTVSAIDEVDGFITSDCFPASGSTFKFGTTTVTCKATDSAGNIAIKTFRVTVQQHTTIPPQNEKIISTFDNQGRHISNGTTTTNIPSSPSPSPQPQLPQQQQQLPRLSPTQPTIPVQPGESGQTAIAPSPPSPPSPPPLHPQSPSSKQSTPVQPGESGQTAIAPSPPSPPSPPPLHPQSPSSKQSTPVQPSHPTP